ncbi:MAG: single-stranded-DNA-specific exonuclease RecJ [Gammaproteobacteria bacterium]|nr:single-stranded-DNA-specific exonuclease RecJ [Gammaproteobacteria bacterium]
MCNYSIIRRESTLQNELPADLHPLLARIYGTRNLSSANELEYSLDKLHPHYLLKGIDQAVEVLVETLDKQKRVLIIGDFDADGATSTALAVQALRLFGFRHVDFLVPNRFEFGYGLTPEIVEVAIKFKPDLIITVDNGISSIEGVKAANKQGIDVLVTDHHLPGHDLPDAVAIVNPNQKGCDFPSKYLAGVGVIFYVMLALRTHLRSKGWFELQDTYEPNLASLLDLVALGTVADVVPLDHNNRILVEQGMRRIRAGQCCSGIRMLAEVAGRKVNQLVAADLGFVIGPRLNAAGRLDDMRLGIECLITQDATTARVMACELDELNKARRNIENQMKTDALQSLSAMKLSDKDENLPVGLCLYDPEWHQGVIGILASRIKDKLHRPVIAFADGDGEYIKGSARSISGVHIRDVLDAIATRHPGLICKFGGHAAAAGLTMKLCDLDAFVSAFDKEVQRYVSQDELKGVVVTDGELAVQELNLDVAELLRNSGPWGQGFPEPVFDGVFEVVNQRIVGEKHLKLYLRHPSAKRGIDAIAFNYDASKWPENTSRVEVAYRLDVNEFRGERSPQMIVEHVWPV